MKTSRRNLLIGAGVIASGCAVLATGPVRRSICGSAKDTYRQEGMARIGAACIACSALAPDALARRWTELASLAHENIAKLVSQDFTNGRIVSVDGWQFAETEAVMFVAARLGLARKNV